MLGKNPSPIGVFWSVLCEPEEGDRQLFREESREYHTNNDAEWLALRAALQHATAHWPDASLTIHSDSLIICNQFNGVWKTRLERHGRLRHQCLAIANGREVNVEWRPRKQVVARLGH